MDTSVHVCYSRIDACTHRVVQNAIAEQATERRRGECTAARMPALRLVWIDLYLTTVINSLGIMLFFRARRHAFARGIGSEAGTYGPGLTSSARHCCWC